MSHISIHATDQRPDERKIIDIVFWLSHHTRYHNCLDLQNAFGLFRTKLDSDISRFDNIAGTLPDGRSIAISSPTGYKTLCAVREGSGDIIIFDGSFVGSTQKFLKKSIGTSEADAHEHLPSIDFVRTARLLLAPENKLPSLEQAITERIKKGAPPEEAPHQNARRRLLSKMLHRLHQCLAPTN